MNQQNFVFALLSVKAKGMFCHSSSNFKFISISVFQKHSSNFVRWISDFYRPQRSCSKVIFSQVSVSHSVHRGGVWQTPPGRHSTRQTPPWTDIPGQTPHQADNPLLPSACWNTPHLTSACWDTPLSPSDHCTGRYTSYWNAFLLIVDLYFTDYSKFQNIWLFSG